MFEGAKLVLQLRLVLDLGLAEALVGLGQRPQSLVVVLVLIDLNLRMVGEVQTDAQ